MKKKFSLFLMMVAVVSMISMFVSCSDYDDSINSLKTQSASDITTVSGQIASLQAQLANLESAYQAADENLEAAISNALASAKNYTDDGLTDAQAAAARDYADVQAAEAELAAIAAAQNLVDAAVAALEEELALLEQNVTDAQTTASALGKAEEALILTQSAQSSAAQALDLEDSDDSDDLESAVEGLQTAVASIEGTVNSILGEMNNLQGDVTSLQGDVKDLFDQAAQNYADIIEVETQLQVLDSANTAEHTALTENISTLTAEIEALQKLVVASSIKIEKALSDSVSGLRDEIAAALDDAEKYADGLSDSLWTTVDDHTAKIESIQEEISAINENLGMLGKRLTSLVFAPTTYVNGIECILFSTLSYTAWKADSLFADGPTGNQIIIADDSHYEEYLVSPSHVAEKSIASLSFISNTATDISTRAVSDDAPIEVLDYTIGKTEGGLNNVLQLHLGKVNPNEELGMNASNFTIVALKAIIAKDYLLADEDSLGDVAVYSDWARLYEEHVTPYIHNALEVDKNGSLIEDATDSHFYTWSDVLTTDSITSISYMGELDLNDLAIVCNDESTSYDLDKYGFELEFNLVDYNQSGDPIAVDSTEWATISDDGVLTTEQGRLAIDKKILIQVVLKDTANESIVDVKYFYIEVTDEPVDINLGEIADTIVDFVCGDDVVVNISYDDLVKACKNAEGGNLTIDELLEYNLIDSLFNSEADAKALTNHNDTLGTVEIVEDTTDGKDSLVWTIDQEYVKYLINKADNEDITIEAWGAFQSPYMDTNIIPFKMVLKIELGMATISKASIYWNNGMRVVNPILDTDELYGTSAGYKTTQLEANLFDGYINNGVTPSDVEEVVTKGEARFIFTDETIKDLESKKIGEEGAWTISEGADTLFYNGEPAAIIGLDEENQTRLLIKLYETDNGSASSETTEGARLLVGQEVLISVEDNYCDITKVVDSYYVAFMTPLNLGKGNIIEVEITDLYTSESKESRASLNGTIEIKEQAVLDGRVVWNNDTVPLVIGDLAAWYGVKLPEYDFENATISMTLNGNPTDNIHETPLKEIKRKANDGSGDYVQAFYLEYEQETNSIVFKNNSGSAVGEEFQICLPVYIETKWQTAFALEIHMTIKPGINN